MSAKALRYQICTRCVMDTSDPDIVFDAEGVCNHCHAQDRALRESVFYGEEAAAKLARAVTQMKQKGAGKPYDCLIGVSGGVDSTYLAMKVKELGLRALAVHLDNGWNSEIAVRNINNTVSRLGFDLYTHVIDWEEFRDLQRAFIQAGLPDVEILSDHAIVATLVQQAKKHQIAAVILGSNPRTESHLPRAWSQGHWDFGYIADVLKTFGKARKLKTYPHSDLSFYLNWRMGKLKFHEFLRFIDFDRSTAVAEIIEKLGWQDYGGKHHESVFTRWFQGRYLPARFGYDKRKAHLSSLIASGQMTREAALAALQPPPYDEVMQQVDDLYVAKKLGYTPDEFAGIMAGPTRTFNEHQSYHKLVEEGVLRHARKSLHMLRRLHGSTR